MSRLLITHYRIKRRKSLLTAKRPFCLAVLADLHNSILGEKDGLLERQIDRLSPEAVLCCGDILTAKMGRAHTDRALSLMRSLSGKYPVYYVNGNHETRMAGNPSAYGGEMQYFRYLREYGVTMLSNASCEASFCGARVKIFGFETDLSYYKRMQPKRLNAEQIRKAVGDPSEEFYNILIAHHPYFFPACAGWGADLVLSGHMHGGMVRLPFLGGVVGASLLPFPKYDRGRFAQEERSGSAADAKRSCEMILSAGLGDHTIPLRWNNPPELVILDI